MCEVVFSNPVHESVVLLDWSIKFTTGSFNRQFIFVIGKLTTPFPPTTKHNRGLLHFERKKAKLIDVVGKYYRGNYTSLDTFHLKQTTIIHNTSCYATMDHVKWFRLYCHIKYIEAIETKWPPDDIFKCNFLNENVPISIPISLKFLPKSPTDNISAMFQIMAWRQAIIWAMMVNLPKHICVTRSQWVQTMKRIQKKLIQIRIKMVFPMHDE